jgi:lactate dehydrogenase-like 2-hydroxyacid dehydrogenase
MARVFVTRQLPGAALDRLRAEHETDVWPDRVPPTYDQLLTHTAGAEGLISLLTDAIDVRLIAGAPRLRAISNYAVGTDNIDLAAAAGRGIPVGNTPDVLTDATADLAFALLLAAARKLPEAARAVRDGDWLTWEPAAHLGQSVHGATLGIVGLGRIGRAVAQRARGFEMEVLATATGTAPGLPLDALLERSDFVSLHCPLTVATHHLIDASALRRMRPTAILVNTARGPIVDQAALQRALEDGTIAGAALDVTDPEPMAPDHPLLAAPNLLVTPHIGSATTVARERMAELAVENLLAGLAGRPMPHQANAPGAPAAAEAARHTNATR